MTKFPSQLDAFVSILGAQAVKTTLEDRTLYSQDIWRKAEICVGVLSPSTPQQVVDCLLVAQRDGLDVSIRGGGMSYTGGYVPTLANTIILDLSLLNRILDVNQEDMTVCVEAGVTWAMLDAVLAPLKLRTPFWGPFSGRVSTIGGALSQNSVFFGSGHYGTAADSVLGLTVALADGTLVTTGSAATKDGSAFFRYYGADTTGLFLGDAGAFGVKTSATLRLMPRPTGRTFASFDFEDRQGLLAAMKAISHAGLASECFAFDPFLQAMRLKRESLSKDFAALKQVVKAEGPLQGLRMALAGRNFGEGVSFALHVSCEDQTTAGAQERLIGVNAIAQSHGGRAIEPTMPRVAHAMPFGPLNGILGANGERWVPVHGVVAHSRAAAMLQELDDFAATSSAKMAEFGITTGYMLCTIGYGAMLIEPVFYWPDALEEIHVKSVAPDFLAGLKRHPANIDARKAVADLRQDAIERFAKQGAIHFQVGKTYPCYETRSPGAQNLLSRLKQALDPDNRLSRDAKTTA
jgi:glycolate oxidase